MHMSIEWHRGLTLSLQLTFEKNTVNMIINIQAQHKIKLSPGPFMLTLQCLHPQGNITGCQIVHYDPLNAKQNSKNEPVWAM